MMAYVYHICLFIYLFFGFPILSLNSSMSYTIKGTPNCLLSSVSRCHQQFSQCHLQIPKGNFHCRLRLPAGIKIQSDERNAFSPLHKFPLSLLVCDLDLTLASSSCVTPLVLSIFFPFFFFFLLWRWLCICPLKGMPTWEWFPQKHISDSVGVSAVPFLVSASQAAMFLFIYLFL